VPAAQGVLLEVGLAPLVEDAEGRELLDVQAPALALEFLVVGAEPLGRVAPELGEQRFPVERAFVHAQTLRGGCDSPKNVL
jgi:hypothetical protein